MEVKKFIKFMLSTGDSELRGVVAVESISKGLLIFDPDIKKYRFGILALKRNPDNMKG